MEERRRVMHAGTTSTNLSGYGMAGSFSVARGAKAPPADPAAVPYRQCPEPLVRGCRW
jgi:hypothetical protein